MAAQARVVSLLPAATEMVCALGLEESLVGRSHECDYPPSILRLPALTSTAINPAAPSDQIDAQVKAAGANPIFELDLPQLEALAPDLILTQTQCGVCAVTSDQLHRLSRLAKQPKVLPLTAQRLADLWADIQNVADALSASDPGRDLIKELKGRCVQVIEKTCQVNHRPTVVCLEWLDPLMAAGNWVPEMVDLAGARALCGEPGQHSDWLSWDTLRKLDPSILVLMPCGLDLNRTRQEWLRLSPQASWERLQAVQNNQVYLTDANQFFNRPGPRLIDSLEILAGLFHPKLITAPKRGSAWARAPL